MSTKHLLMTASMLGLLCTAVPRPPAPPEPAFPDIHSVSLLLERGYVNNEAVEFNPYELNVSVRGRGLEGVIVTPPGAEAVELEYQGQGTWEADDDLLGRFQEPPTGLYRFDFLGGAARGDSVTLLFDPTPTTGFAFVTFPTPLSADVPLHPVFEWEPVDEFGNSLDANLNDVQNDITLGNDLLSITATSWPWPGRLHPSVDHEFDIEVANISVSEEMTAGDDHFGFSSGYGQLNCIYFSTAP